MSRAQRNVVVVSNLFPPQHVGGYELACADVVDGLRQRGWRPIVLTSWHGIGHPRIEKDVLRVMRVHLPGEQPYSSKTSEIAWGLWDRVVCQSTLNVMSAQGVHVFNTSGLGGLLVDAIHTQPRPVVHDVSDIALPRELGWDTWFAFANNRAGTSLKRVAKASLLRASWPLLPTAAAPLDLERSYFRSYFLKQAYTEAGLDTRQSPVIYHGVRLADYTSDREESESSSILFAGRISPEKGAHVFLEAMKLLQDSPLMLGRTVTIAGARTYDDYWERVHNTALELRGRIQINLRGQVQRSHMPQLYRRHGIFVLPAIWDEPFSIALLEAMAAGEAIIATSTGGSKEILRDGENSLVISKNDPSALADALLRVIGDSGLRRRIARGARETVRRFDLDETMDRIDSHLQRALASGGSNKSDLAMP